MTVERKVGLLFAANAVINWTVSVRGIVDPVGATLAFGAAAPITAAAITSGYSAGDIPARLMILIVFTNWLWIPFIVWADLAVRKGLKVETAA